MALEGTACGQLLSIFKFDFGYPESQESKDRGKQLEELECKFESDNYSPGNEDTVSKSQDILDAASHFSTVGERKAKHRKFGQCHDSLKDLIPLANATPIVPSTSVKLSETGVSHWMYSKREGSEGQSIYHCRLLKPTSTEECTYYAAQLTAMCTHIQFKHLKLSIKCQLCGKKSYSSPAISIHLRAVHCGDMDNWFEPTPALEGDITEVTDEIQAANLQEIENIKEELEEAE